MKNSYSIEEIRRAEREKIKAIARAEGVSESEASLFLIERAARALSALMLETMEKIGIGEALIVCGRGVSGAEGFACAQLLLEQGKDVGVLCPFEEVTPACAEIKRRFQGERLGRIPRRRYALICDCVLGSADGAPEGEENALIEFINSCGAYVVSCDLPCGLGENGIAHSPCVTANCTLSIGGLKTALLLSSGADVSGEIRKADLGLECGTGVEIWEDKDVRAFFPARKRFVNKGCFGSAAFLLERAAFSGAVFLSAQACLASGAGYTKLFAPEPLLVAAAGRLPAVILCEKGKDILTSDAIAYGMGAGATRETYEQVLEFLSEFSGTLILDADALNALALFGLEPLKRSTCRVILTPHPGEFARLKKKSVNEILRDAVALSQEFAAEYNVVLMLKNNRTIVTDGTRTSLLTTGCPALAKGGSGDALSGFLAGTCARGVEPFSAACISSYLLGRAGEIAAGELGEYSPDAQAVIQRLPGAILSILE